MGFIVVNPSANISGLNWDANLIIPTGKQVTSIDTSGSVGTNLNTQIVSTGIVGIAMGGN